MLSIHEQLNELLFSNTPFVMATLVDVIGSSPQDIGSKMLVTKDGLHGGTVGGGKVEFKAINEAKALLESQYPTKSFVEWNLKNDVGMSCGGIVRLYFEAFIPKYGKLPSLEPAMSPMRLSRFSFRWSVKFTAWTLARFGLINFQNRLNYH